MTTNHQVGSSTLSGCTKGLEMTIEEQDKARAARIVAAPDWPTTRTIMADRHAWRSQHRKWCDRCRDWVPLDRSHI